jgi:hypothetical protein
VVLVSSLFAHAPRATVTFALIKPDLRGLNHSLAVDGRDPAARHVFPRLRLDAKNT